MYFSNSYKVRISQSVIMPLWRLLSAFVASLRDMGENYCSMMIMLDQLPMIHFGRYINFGAAIRSKDVPVYKSASSRAVEAPVHSSSSALRRLLVSICGLYMSMLSLIVGEK